jgi:hypothetical protein
LEGIRRMLQRYKEYNVNNCLKVLVNDEQVEKMEKERQKWREKLTIEQILNHKETKQNQTIDLDNKKQENLNELNVINQMNKQKKESEKQTQSLRLEVFKNDGQKNNSKVVLLKTDDFEELKRMACNKLRLNFHSHVSKLYDMKGKEISSIFDLKKDQQIFVAAHGEGFLQMALKQKKNNNNNNNKNLEDEQNEHANEQTNKKMIGITKKIFRLPVGYSEIIPNFLYLGSARDSLESVDRFSHILNVASDWPIPNEKPNTLIKYLKLDYVDTMGENILQHLDLAFEFIEDVKESGFMCCLFCFICIFFFFFRLLYLFIFYLFFLYFLFIYLFIYLFVVSRRSCVSSLC